MPCSVNGCPEKVIAKQLCRKHYYRLKRTGTTDDPVPRRKTCTIEGCDDPAHGNGLCAKHWARNNRHGDPSIRLKQRDPGPPEVNWTAKVSVESPGCWVWTAGTDGNGYGWHASAKKRAHQFVWELLVGPVSDGMELDHLCRRPICCNPDHLDAVSHKTNVDRGSNGAGKLRRKRFTLEEKRVKRNAYQRDYMRRKRAEATPPD